MRASLAPLALLLAVAPLAAQEGAPEATAGQEPAPQAPAQEGSKFEQANASLDEKLDAARKALDAQREAISAESLPLNEKILEMQRQVSALRRELQTTTSELTSASVELTNKSNRVEARKASVDFLANLMTEFVREFGERLHVAEEARYAEVLEPAELAVNDTTAQRDEIFSTQGAVMDAALGRLESVLGGETFPGVAVDAGGVVRQGRYLLLGPAALFRADDGAVVGTAERRPNASRPAVVEFADPEDAAAAGATVSSGVGDFPLDTSLGNAHLIAATEETLLEHIQKGGAVMVPIFVMAGLALLIALGKWFQLALVRRPSRKRVDALMVAIEAGDDVAAKKAARAVAGPVGLMLTRGVEVMHESRELVEEVMYEVVLKTRLKLQSMLPFIAICAASAPLLGLLGTVTGIISTFKMITLFGSGDVKSLSGGISEALITTKFGLIVAIPSLLLHAFLSRKARGQVANMEKAAVSFSNELGRLHATGDAKGPGAPDPELVREQVNEILGGILGNEAAAEQEVAQPAS